MAGVRAVTDFIQESQQVAGIFTFAAAAPSSSCSSSSQNPKALLQSYSPFSPYLPCRNACQDRSLRRALLPDRGKPFHPLCLHPWGNRAFKPVLQSQFADVQEENRPQEDFKEDSGREPVKKQKLFFQIVHVYWEISTNPISTKNDKGKSYKGRMVVSWTGEERTVALHVTGQSPKVLRSPIS